MTPYVLPRYNQEVLGLDFLELLERFIPSDYEMKPLVNYEKEGREIEALTDEDRFMLRFGRIPRLSQRISTLTFMGNFPETVKRLQPVRSLQHFSYLRRHHLSPPPRMSQCDKRRPSFSLWPRYPDVSGVLHSNWTPSSLRPCPSSPRPS